MIDLLQQIGLESLVILWMPVLLWSFAFILVYTLLRGWRHAPPQIHFQTLWALLIALPSSLLLALVIELPLLKLPWGGQANTSLAVLLNLPGVVVSAGERATVTNWNVYSTLGLITMVLAGGVLWRLIRFGLEFAALSRFKRQQINTNPIVESQFIDRLMQEMHIRCSVKVIASRGVSVPMTFGWRRPVVIVPQTLLSFQDDLEMALAHEFVHIRRNDFFLQGIEQLIGVFFYFHPAVWLLRHELDRDREISCDVEVLRRPHTIRKAYADLLYRFVRPVEKLPTYGIGMIETRHFKQRITAMKNFAQLNRIQNPRLVGSLLALLTLTSTAVFVVSCTDITGTERQAMSEQKTAEGSEEVFAVVEKMPELIGGLQSIQEQIHYPEIAKIDGIEGRVIVQFVVDEEGNVTDAEVVRGIGGGCDEEAVRALEKAKFIPGVQKGENVSVKMSIPISFKLAGKKNQTTGS